MPARVLWFDRGFEFRFPADWYPEILERLRGTPVRLEAHLGGVSPASLTVRPGGKWSLLEHAGHLWDLEELWMGRLDDYDHGEERLRPADLTNRKTHEADHNGRAPEEILASFRRERERMVSRLDALPPGAFARTSLHPRLETPMRTCDLMFFVAEHDDYHLARITEARRR